MARSGSFWTAKVSPSGKFITLRSRRGVLSDLSKWELAELWRIYPTDGPARIHLAAVRYLRESGGFICPFYPTIPASHPEFAAVDQAKRAAAKRVGPATDKWGWAWGFNYAFLEALTDLPNVPDSLLYLFTLLVQVADSKKMVLDLNRRNYGIRAGHLVAFDPFASWDAINFVFDVRTWKRKAA